MTAAIYPVDQLVQWNHPPLLFSPFFVVAKNLLSFPGFCHLWMQGPDSLSKLLSTYLKVWAYKKEKQRKKEKKGATFLYLQQKQSSSSLAFIKMNKCCFCATHIWIRPHHVVFFKGGARDRLKRRVGRWNGIIDWYVSRKYQPVVEYKLQPGVCENSKWMSVPLSF